MPTETYEKWLKITKESAISSTSFVDANYRKEWEDAIRAFQSRHHSASKYHSNQFKYRSKIFRPKTRSAIRNNEAAAAAAFFTNNDVVSISAENPNDPMQRASADLMQELLQYRLTKTIPWFLTCIGAFQDAEVIGVVASYQSWKYQERKSTQLVPTNTPGTFVEEPVTIIIEDRPDIELIPVENVRIHPASDWRDPVNTSPFLLRLIPMYAIDVKQRMEESSVKGGQPKWFKLTDDQLHSGTALNFDPTRLTREEGREDPMSERSSSTSIKDYDIVWIIENIVRDPKGRDVVYYTVGLEHMLSAPKYIEEVYFTGKRPVAMGIAIIETHKIYPSGVSNLGKNIQREINEVTNSRLDNVKLVLNKRYFVKRGSQVDLKSILMNVAGSITFVNEPETDVKAFDFNDVTSSSYEEQTRLSTEYDELVGNFSQSSVANNRKLNETVGGMQMIRAASFGLTEYLIRTFSETWVKEVLQQLIQLEQKYETDMVVVTLAGEKAKLFQKYGIDQVTDEMLNQQLTLTVNVGIGATDPITKLNQFVLAMKHLKDILTDPPPGLNIEEVQKEIFGRLGHSDGSRFFLSEQDVSPEERQLMETIQQQQQIIDELKSELTSNIQDNLTKLRITDVKERGANVRKKAELETEIAVEAIKLENPVPGEKISGQRNR